MKHYAWHEIDNLDYDCWEYHTPTHSARVTKRNSYYQWTVKENKSGAILAGEWQLPSLSTAQRGAFAWIQKKEKE